MYFIDLDAYMDMEAGILWCTRSFWWKRMSWIRAQRSHLPTRFMSRWQFPGILYSKLDLGRTIYSCHVGWCPIRYVICDIRVILIMLTCIIQRRFQNNQRNVMMVLAIYIIRMNHNMWDDMINNCWCTKAGYGAVRVSTCVIFTNTYRWSKNSSQ